MKIKNKKGFSILEVLAAVFVLSIGLTAVLALISGSIMNSIDSRNVIIASGLAQEGAELVRNIRDTNFVSKTETDPNYPFENMDNSLTYKIDYYNNGLVQYNNNYQLNYNNNGFYTHSNGDQTKFRRKIEISNYPSSGTVIGRTIKSIVWWSGEASAPGICNIGTKCVSSEEVLTSW